METLNFDWNLYGLIIKRHRKIRGVYTAKELSELIYLRTRTKVSKDALYRIEQGRQVPNAEQFMAINLTLFNDLFPYRFAEIKACVSEDWQHVRETCEISERWLDENTADAYKRYGYVTDSGLKIVPVDLLPIGEYVRDRDWLFPEERFPVPGVPQDIVFATREGYCFSMPASRLEAMLEIEKMGKEFDEASESS